MSRNSAMKPKVDIEIAHAKALFSKVAREFHWDDDVRDYAIRQAVKRILAARMRRAKVRKHDDARKLLLACASGEELR